jgi:hypothetical protein
VRVSGLIESWRALVFRRKLDRKIANGVDPSSAPELTRRARQLVSPGCRRRMAAGLQRAMREAERPWRPRLTAQVPIQRGAILDAQAQLLGLARLLTGEEQVSARGVARVEELLTDGRSPLYFPAPRGALAAAARHARVTLLLGQGA